MLGASATPILSVSLAGAAIRGDSILVGQNRAMLRLSGVPGQYRRGLCLGSCRLICVPDQESRRNLSGQHHRLPAQLADNLSHIASMPLGAWMSHFIAYDPAEAISRVHCPVMAVNGSLDIQVLAADNLPALRRHLPDNPANLVKEYPGLNHRSTLHDQEQ